MVQTLHHAELKNGPNLAKKTQEGKPHPGLTGPCLASKARKEVLAKFGKAPFLMNELKLSPLDT